MKIRLNILLCTLLILFSCGSKSEDSEQKNNVMAVKKETIIKMDTYLENEATNHFWELKLRGKSIIIHSGKIGSAGEENSEKYSSKTIARYETYKLINNKNNEGFITPKQISFETLLTYKPVPAKDTDVYLEQNHHDNFIVINGDLHLDELNMDALNSKTDGLIINGNLTVDGPIYNNEGDYGPALVVKGNVRANNLVAGGSEIHFKGETYIHGFIVSHYNHGLLWATDDTTAMVAIESDHNTWLGKSAKITYSYDVYAGDIDDLKETLGEESDLISGDDFETDKLMNIISKNDNAAILKLLRKFLDANHADNPLLVQVMKNGLTIKGIENPNETLQLAAVKQNGLALEFIKNPSEAVQSAAVIEDSSAVNFIKNPSEKVQLALVGERGWNISYLKNPSDKVIEHAIRNDGNAIEYIKNPSEALQVLAVSHKSHYFSNAIEHIKNPSEKVQLAAVKLEGDALEYIVNPTEAVKLAAVKQDGTALRYIKNPSYEMQLLAMKTAGWIIESIKNPSDELMLEAVKQESAAIKGIKNPSEEAQLIVVKENAFNIADIKNPTEKVQLAAVSDIGDSIESIKNPSEAVQLAAIRQDPQTIELIEKPTKQAIKLAKELIKK